MKIKIKGPNVTTWEQYICRHTYDLCWVFHL